MADEIERRFILPEAPNLPSAASQSILQGYLNFDPNRTVRIRIIDDHAFITVKGKRTGGAGKEFEYGIPLEDALQLMELCDPQQTIEKKRISWHSAEDNHIWEIDIFGGKLGGPDGLVIAEVELPSISTPVANPSWLEGAVEITDNNYFSNSNMARMDGETIKSMRDRALIGEEINIVPEHLTQTP